MLANGTGKTTTEQVGKNWYILYPNYAFGQDMEKSFSAAITAAGGKVVGKDGAPFPNTSGDFSTYLLKAPTLNPKPDVLGTMQAGAELVNVVKQYNEFKLRDKGVGLAVGLMFLTDIHSLTPDALAGTTYTDAWYWNFDAKNRPFADRFQQRPAPGRLRARRQLLGRDAVPGGGAGRRHRRRRRGGQAAGGQEDRGRLPAQRQDPRRGPPGGARRLPGPGEAAGRGHRAVGLREGRSRRIPAAEAFRAPSPRQLQAVECSGASLQNTFNGLVSGAFYALLALGLAVIFGMLRVVNFAHGAFYMLGAFGAYVLLSEAGVPFWVGAGDRAGGAGSARHGAGARR